VVVSFPIACVAFFGTNGFFFLILQATISIVIVTGLLNEEKVGWNRGRIGGLGPLS